MTPPEHGTVPGPPPGVRTTAPPDGEVTRLVLVRHGEARCNVEGVCGGARGCTGLTERGVRQVMRLRDRLRSSGELAGVEALVTSILPRAIETATLLAPALAPEGGTEPEARTDCGVCELHPGEADGLTWTQFSTRFGDPDWDREPERPIAPGGESWTGFVRRVDGSLQHLAERYRGQRVVVACHAGVVEASLLARLPVVGGLDGSRLQLRTSHASMTTWEVDERGWRLLAYNDASHLQHRRGSTAGPRGGDDAELASEATDAWVMTGRAQQA